MKKRLDIRKVFHGLLLYSVFAVYMLILFALLFLKTSSFRSVNLIPFASIMNFLNGGMLARSFAFTNVAGNIVLFFPLGVYTALFCKNIKIGANICLIAFISIFSETAQYLFSVGAADIDDVILNTAGGFAGILAFKLIHRIFGEKTRFAIEILAPVAGISGILILTFINRPF